MTTGQRSLYVVVPTGLEPFEVGVFGVFSSDERARVYVDKGVHETVCRAVDVCPCVVDERDGVRFGEWMLYTVDVSLHGGAVSRREVLHYWDDLDLPVPEDTALVRERASLATVRGKSYVSEERAFEAALRARDAWLEKRGLTSPSQPHSLAEVSPASHFTSEDFEPLPVLRPKPVVAEGREVVYVVTEVSDSSGDHLLPDAVFSTREKALLHVAESRRGQVLEMALDVEAPPRGLD